MKYVCPVITVSDINRARIFYENVLDQRVKYDFGENVTFHGDFAIHLDTHFSKLIENNEIIQESNSFELYFEDDDLDSLAKKLDSCKIELIHPIREQPWKQRVIRFYDPDRNIIEVGESLEYLIRRLIVDGNSIDRISEITGLDISLISYLLKN